MAWNSLSETLSNCSLPGMQLLSTSGSLSLAHTTSRLAGSWTCPFMVIAIGLLRHSRRSDTIRYRGSAGHGQSAFVMRRALFGIGAPLAGSSKVWRAQHRRGNHYAQRQCRRLSDLRRSRGPGTRARAHAVEFARPHAAHVGSPGCAADAALSPRTL